MVPGSSWLARQVVLMVYRFDDVEVDPEAFQARKRGVPVALEPKAFEVLLVLLRFEGRLVTKAGLQEAVWPGTFVTEGTLTRLVAQLRKSLGDDARDARYIETVPTRGYRFVARLDGGSSPSPSHPSEPVARDAATLPAASRSRKVRTVLLLTVCVIGLAGLVATTMPRGTPTTSPAAPHEPRMLVSSAMGFNAYPAFSPDGSSLAFSSDRTGAIEIWIRSLAPGARELQVTNDGQNNVHPAWSPDGTLLAFTSMGRRGIWTIPALGGVPRRVTAFGSGPAWSPDGRTIAFVSSETVQVDLNGSTTSRIWIVPAEGGEPRPVTERWKPPGGHRSLCFSPDGRSLAFTAAGQVFVVDLETGEHRAVTPSTAEPGPGRFGFGGWAEVRFWHDGKAIVGLGIKDHEPVLWRYDLSGRGTVSSAPLVVGDPMQLVEHLALSPDGRRIAYAVVNTHSDLLAFTPGQDGRPSSPPSPLFPTLNSRKGLPQFSADGRIAFLLWRPGEGSVLYTARSDGQRPAPVGRLSNPGGFGFDPEGRVVAVVRDSARARDRLVEIDPASGGERTLRELPPAAWARLSPDGRDIAFMCGGQPVFAICVASVTGSEVRTLLAPEEGAGWPVWGPDGRRLAVELYDGEDTYVAVVPREGGAPRRVTREGGQSWPHSWTPDGRRVVFAGQRRGIWNLYAVDVETGEERRLTDYERAVVNVRYPASSPDGERVAFEYSELSGNVWVAPLRWP